MNSPSVILGIGGLLGHDANAALLVDGRLIASSQEELHTRGKHDGAFPHNAIAYDLVHELFRRLVRQFAPVPPTSPAASSCGCQCDLDLRSYPAGFHRICRPLLFP